MQQASDPEQEAGEVSGLWPSGPLPPAAGAPARALTHPHQLRSRSLICSSRNLGDVGPKGQAWGEELGLITGFWPLGSACFLAVSLSAVTQCS